MKKKLIAGFSLVLGFSPFMAFAQNATNCTTGVQDGTIQKIICQIGNILDTIIPVLIVLGIVFFVWGVISYVIGDDEEAKKKGKNRMIYGIIGLVVIVSMWGLVGIVTNTFNLSGTANVVIPSLPL